MSSNTASDVQIWEAKEPWARTRCKLGEGPIEEESTGKLRFLDMPNNQVLWLDPKKGPSSLEKLDVKDCVGVTFDIEGDDKNIIVGAKYGYAYMELATGALTYLTQPSQLWTAAGEKAEEKAGRMRFNDGNIDGRGRFWCGMINDPAVTGFSPEGALFCLSADGRTVRRLVDGVTISNGLGWSPDEKTMYYTDSITRTIVAYDFDLDAGTISNRRVWYDSGPEGEEGGAFVGPDGFCQDEEDCFWVALYGGWKVVRLKDVDGKAVKIGEVKIPTRCITCPRIIDKTLWVTTAGEHEDGHGPESKKFDGDTFAVPVGVGPKKPYKWRKP